MPILSLVDQFRYFHFSLIGYNHQEYKQKPPRTGIKILYIMKTFYTNTLPNNHVNQYVDANGHMISDLISYTTKVASYKHQTNEMQVFGWFSQTTAKHINSFLSYYGFCECNKKQLQNYEQ